MGHQWVKRIQVKGGTIYFDMGKPEQLSRLAEAMLQASKKAAADGMDRRVDYRPFSREIAEEFERIFGKNATVKTFNTVTPSIEQWEEFCGKFTVLVNEWIEEARYGS